MLKLLLVREIKTEKQTHGRLFKINDKDQREFICYTLEDKERLVKIKGQTAIPTGKYTVIVTMSPRFKKELPLILNVPDFSGVRFHGGNTEKDSEGCPLLGMVRHMDSISNCAPAVALVTKMIKEAKEAQLTIV
jgi:hypothetical protein